MYLRKLICAMGKKYCESGPAMRPPRLAGKSGSQRGCLRSSVLSYPAVLGLKTLITRCLINMQAFDRGP